VQPNCIPDDLHSIVASIADGVSSKQLTIADLPANWRDYPAPASLRDIGSAWLKESQSLFLVVPSAVNPNETNILVNPLHPEITAITAIRSKPFHFDPRMWKATPAS
jgi:RES domain-containing protein